MAQKETEQLNRMLIGGLISRAICTIADLGIADHIEPGTPRSAADLAKLTGVHERSLHRALRCLASHGVFQETAAGEFDHSALSSVLRSGGEGSYRAGGQLFHFLLPAYDGLDHSIRTGESGFAKVFGKPLFEYVAEHPQLGPIFDAGMTAFHGFETTAMIAAYDFGGIEVLADVGGGNGSLIAAVLQRYPAMRGILFDLGHVAERARAALSSSGVADRCRVIEGSFFESVPAGADAYLLRHILHDWTDEQCVGILRQCSKALAGNGRLLIVECVVPAGNAESLAKDFDVLMMNIPGGLERTEPEYRTLLRQAGFELESVTPTSTMVSVIEARPIAAA